mmetsp:Transcript_87983/g.273336  ORF Transcript_87983/g.273336 Transcript_87983/m.273336 type:complete len:223 (+) Transcript_87983:344-1012(+)
MAASEPAHVKPLGKSSLAIWQTAPVFSRTWAQCSSRRGFSTPAIDSVACGGPRATSATASAHTFTSERPVWNPQTPATVSAVNSPMDKPAKAPGRSTASGFCARSFSTAAKPATYTAGRQTPVSSSLDSGPRRQTSSRSKPRIFSASSSISCTFGILAASSIIDTYCDPRPGNRRPIFVGTKEVSTSGKSLGAQGTTEPASCAKPACLAGSCQPLTALPFSS